MGVRFLLGTLCSKEGPTKWEDALLLCAAIAEGNFHAAHPVEVGANKSRAWEDALLLCAAIAEGNFHAAHPVEVGANKSRAREDALLLCAAIAAYLC